LAEMKRGLDDGSIELRTNLRTGASYKEGIRDLTSSDETLNALRQARLPHWVWVVEAHDRTLCARGGPCVVAAAVFDSTAFDFEPPLDILALPGKVFVYPPDDARIVEKDGSAEAWDSLLKVH
jgi:hypothetical protein